MTNDIVIHVSPYAHRTAIPLTHIRRRIIGNTLSDMHNSNRISRIWRDEFICVIPAEN